MLGRITDDIWALEDDLKLPLGMLLPSRTTLVRLPKNEIAVWSPLAIDDAHAEQIDALGDVSHIIAPSNVHYLFLAAAAKRWPKARLFGPPGLERKVDGLSFDPLPRDGEMFGGEILVRRIEGVPYMVEHAFLHARSKSLLVTDLVFNVHACRGAGMPLFLRSVGAWKKTAQSRFWRFLTKDREAAKKSVVDVFAWDFDRLIMAHGDVLDADAREPLARALAWMVS
ncbi:MAG: DUF4336 domain-containing protein [Labilithrix sp.]|nr:DUF4336 domain-containing protein [Labilithrix sp.]